MKDKKQDEKALEELVKAADALRDAITDFGERLSKLLPDIEIPDEKEEDTWEMKCPYKIGDEYYYVYGDGCVRIESWDNFSMEISRWRSGNTFPTKEAAELEAKRRNLLTRFRAFRDECNGDWKPNWRKNEPKYYFYISSTDGEIGINDIYFYETFPLFGYFKNEQDAERAIELFGDEIKELFMEKRLENENN